MNIILGYILTILYVLLVLIICTILKEKNIIKEELSRKLIHILVSFCWIIMTFTVKDTIHQIIIPIIFIILNYISYRFNLIKGMEREDEKSLGTVYYAISIEAMAFISYFNPNLYPLYGMAVYVMAIGDGLAPIIANKIKSKKILNTSKTYSGSLTVLIITILITTLFKNIYDLNISYTSCILLSVIGSIIELFSKKGLDNILLPLSIFGISYLMIL